MENAKTRQWILVEGAENIPVKEGRRVKYGEREIALFNLGTEFRAVDNQCPHKAGPLAEGIIAGSAVFCPLHNWKINLENGCALSGGTGQVKTYPVKQINQKIYVAFKEGTLHTPQEAHDSAEDVNG